jgi:hypothetical protein
MSFSYGSHAAHGPSARRDTLFPPDPALLVTTTWCSQPMVCNSSFESLELFARLFSWAPVHSAAMSSDVLVLVQLQAAQPIECAWRGSLSCVIEWEHLQLYACSYGGPVYDTNANTERARNISPASISGQNGQKGQSSSSRNGLVFRIRGCM